MNLATAEKRLRAMKRGTSWALRLPFLLLVMGRSWSQQQDAGLFPPVEFRSSFSSFRSVSTTSTCSPCTEVGCTTCNSTCPHGQESQQPVNMLEEGELSSGVVRTPCQLSMVVCKHTPSLESRVYGFEVNIWSAAYSFIISSTFYPPA